MPFRQEVASESEFAATVAKIEQDFKPDVLSIRYNVKPDWQGEDALFFQILLRDMAEKASCDLARRIHDRIMRKVYAANVGIFPHFSFRTESEQRVLGDKGWA